MGQNGKIRLYIAGLAAILLIAATIATVMVLRLKGNGDGQQEPATPSGTVELSAMDPVEVQQTAVTDSQGSSSEGTDYSSYPLNNAADCQAVIDAYAVEHGIDPFAYPVDISNLLLCVCVHR